MFTKTLLSVGLLLLTLYQSSFSFAQINMRIEKENIIKSSLHSMDSCIFTLVESMAENVTYAPGQIQLMSTYFAHKRLLSRAKKTIHLSTFYWTLRGEDTVYYDYSDAQGEDIFKSLMDIVLNTSVELRIVQNNTNKETEKLEAAGAQVRSLNFQRLLGAGIMHTKMWLIDGMHAYIGSANFDWRAYSQIKELGVLIENCPTLTSDAEKLFEVYWYLANESHPSVPDQWPSNYSTSINLASPELLKYNQTQAYVYLSSSPKPLCPDGRTNDIDAVLDVIRTADQFIYISVMDYLPIYMYSPVYKFWPVIDDELRRAAFERNISVSLMASKWNHTDPEMFPFLKSLNILSGATNPRINIAVKFFEVPAVTKSQEKIEYARVQHSKYMVTDKKVYIGTSNWSGDYFNSTAGVGFILQDTKSSSSSLRQQLVDVFLRDWNSNYTQSFFSDF